jgi:large subunit ribosomal protein L9
MDVILTKDVDKLGKEGNVIHVKPGYARNYLLPAGLAVPASKQTMNAIQENKKRQEAKAARIKKQAESLKQKIESKSLTLKLSLGESDKAFGSVTTNDIIEALANEKITIDKHSIELTEAIKGLGIYEIPVKLHPEVSAVLKLWVVKA